MNSNDTGFLLGFNSLTEQCHDVVLPYHGDTLPDWLNGTYLRNGPGLFELGPTASFRHFFDGEAMIHGFSFKDGGVVYNNQFLASTDYQVSTARQRISFTEFGSAPQRNLWQKIKATLNPSSQFGCNNSVNVVNLADAIVAVSDYPVPLKIDPANCATLGEYAYDDDLGLIINSPHPLWDEGRSEQINFGIKISLGGCAYVIFRIADGSRQREKIAEVPVSKPAYMHSFALTDNFVILTEHPLPVSLLGMATMGLRDRSLVDSFNWRPDQPSRFIVVDRNNGKHVGTFDTESFFVFHHSNAFEQDGNIIIDLYRYDNFDVVNSLYFEHLRGSNGAQVEPCYPYRYEIDPRRGEVNSQRIADLVLELPMINFAYSRKRYRYVYGESATMTGTPDFYDRLVKLDVESGASKLWHEPGCYMAEPRFVAKPDGRDEDEGVVLTIVLDSNNNHSFLLILDAGSFREIGRASIPHVVPYGLHSIYVET